MASNKLTVSDLDFDNIKTNLKTFMQGQSEFQDYDFELGFSFSVNSESNADDVSSS